MPDYLSTPDYSGFGLGGVPPEPGAMGNAVQNALNLAQRYAQQKVQQVATLPQRAFQSSENLRMGGDYDPAPILEAAGNTLGTGAIARLASPGIIPSAPLRVFKREIPSGFGSLIPLDQRT